MNPSVGVHRLCRRAGELEAYRGTVNGGANGRLLGDRDKKKGEK